jgi:hypothetical protein
MFWASNSILVVIRRQTQLGATAGREQHALSA